MTAHLPPTLERVARANPARADDELGRAPDARAGLERILATERPARDRRAQRRGRRVLIVAFAALLLAAGAAFAATDPFGLFASPNPGTAIFGVDPSRHVAPPTAFRIACPHPSEATFTCGARLGGAQRYVLLDHVEPSGPPLTRPGMQAAIRGELRRGQLGAEQAARLRTDLGAVSDQFLDRLNVLLRFGTLTTNLTPEGTRRMAPPVGVPSLAVCEPAGRLLRCRDLNGDSAAAVGSGIYQAVPDADWRPAPAHQPDPSAQLEVAILGHPPTAPEERFLIDLLRSAATTASSGSTPTRVR
jgi:hypothetical protein